MRKLQEKGRKGKSTDRMRELALDIYDTVVDQSKLPGALQRFAEAIDARGCIVFEMPDRALGQHLTVSAHSEGYEPAVINNYISRFAQQEACRPSAVRSVLVV